MINATLGYCPSAFVDNGLPTFKNHVHFSKGNSATPNTTLISDALPVGVSPVTTSFCFLSKEQQFLKEADHNNSLSPKIKTAQITKSKLTPIDAVPLTILENLAQTVTYKFLYFNLMIGTFFFPLQLLHFQAPINEKPVYYIDSGFDVTENLIETLVSRQRVNRPAAIKNFRLVPTINKTAEIAEQSHTH